MVLVRRLGRSPMAMTDCARMSCDPSFEESRTLGRGTAEVESHREVGAVGQINGSAMAELSPIMMLFQQWNASRDAADRYSEEHEDDEEGFVRLCAKTNDIMLQIAALPATSAQDFAAKLASLTHYGNYDELDGDTWGLGSALLREAAALVGHPEHVANWHCCQGGAK